MSDEKQKQESTIDIVMYISSKKLYLRNYMTIRMMSSINYDSIGLN